MCRRQFDFEQSDDRMGSLLAQADTWPCDCHDLKMQELIDTGGSLAVLWNARVSHE